MSIISVGEIFESKFGDRVEKKFEILLGGLPVSYSILRPHRNLEADSKYKLALKLNEEQFKEIHGAILSKLEQLNKEGGYGASKKKLEEILDRVVGEATNSEGAFRLFGSKKMAFTNKDSGQLEPTQLKVYDKVISEESLVKDVMLGAGSKVRSSFIVSLFKKGTQVFMNMNPNVVVVLEKVDVPRSEKAAGPDFSQVEDSDYDY